MDAIKTVLLAADRNVRATLAAALQGSEVQVTESLAPTEEVLSLLMQVKPQAVVLYHENEEALFTLAQRIYISRLADAVILVCSNPTADILAKTMACGAAGAVDYALIDETLAKAVADLVRREQNRHAAPAPSGAYASRVLCSFGTKGGTGKTLFGVNLAVALAGLGKKVALVDLDLQFGDVGVFLDIVKSDSLADVAQENAFEFAALKSYLTLHKSGVEVLCAPVSPEYAEMVLPQHITQTIAALRPNYDFVVLDLPPAFDDGVLAALESADTLYFVVTPDISALRNAKASFAVLESLGLSDKLQVVINKNGGAGLKQKDLEKVLERKAALVLPCDLRGAVKSVNRGVPVVMGDKRSALAAAFTAFAAPLCGSVPSKKFGKR